MIRHNSVQGNGLNITTLRRTANVLNTITIGIFMYSVKRCCCRVWSTASNLCRRTPKDVVESWFRYPDQPGKKATRSRPQHKHVRVSLDHVDAHGDSVHGPPVTFGWIAKKLLRRILTAPNRWSPSWMAKNRYETSVTRFKKTPELCTPRSIMCRTSFGYDQHLTLQLDAITNHGIPSSQIFKDKLSGARRGRPGLSKCVDALGIGEVDKKQSRPVSQC